MMEEKKVVDELEKVVKDEEELSDDELNDAAGGKMEAETAKAYKNYK